jgi:hypothetical protein
MNKFEQNNQKFYDCVKDLDSSIHLGGFPARAVVIERSEGEFELYKANLDPTKAINLVKALAKNETGNWIRIHSVNQKTKTRVDTTHNKVSQ